VGNLPITYLVSMEVTMIFKAIRTAILVAIACAVPLRAAYARCDAPTVLYELSKPSKIWMLTSARSDWADEGATPTYTKSKTAEVGASVTATVGAEAGVIFAQASTSIGVQASASYSVTNSQSFSKPVPPGKIGRLVMYHEGRTFKVTKKQFVPPCSYRTVYTESVDAPVKTGDSLWVLQTQDRKSQHFDQLTVAVFHKQKARPTTKAL